MWHEVAKQLVQAQGLSQVDLMPVFSVNTAGAVGHYLNGRRQPTPQQLKRLADYLNVQIDDFFVARDAPAPASVHNLRNVESGVKPASLTVKGAATSTLPHRYAWSNPAGVSDDVLIRKIILAGRFEDVLAAVGQYGLVALSHAAASMPSVTPRTRRMLNNINQGFVEAGMSASEASAYAS